MLISITTGHETFTNPSVTASIYAYYHKSKTDKTPINFAQGRKDMKTLFLKPTTNKFYDASNYNTNHGFWVEGQYDLPEGGMVTLQISKRDKENRFGISQENILIIPRAKAAYREMALRLSGHTKASLNTVYVEGRFDVVWGEDFDRLGISVPKFLGKDMYIQDEDELGGSKNIIALKTKERELEALESTITKTVEIETKTGGTVKVVKAAKRKLRLNRR